MTVDLFEKLLELLVEFRSEMSGRLDGVAEQDTLSNLLEGTKHL